MSDINKKLLEEVIEQKLNESLGVGDKETFNEAMQAYDRYIELRRIEDAAIKSEQELELKKQEAENEYIKYEAEIVLKKKHHRNELIIKGVEITGLILVAPLTEYVTKMSFAKNVMLFERDDSFLTQAGRSLSGLFRWKK